jgi:hypothetical protein
MRYVHTLLFDCPRCKFPIAISLIKEEQNLEEIDVETLHTVYSLPARILDGRRHSQETLR